MRRNVFLTLLVLLLTALSFLASCGQAAPGDERTSFGAQTSAAEPPSSEEVSETASETATETEPSVEPVYTDFSCSRIYAGAGNFPDELAAYRYTGAETDKKVEPRRTRTLHMLGLDLHFTCIDGYTGYFTEWWTIGEYVLPYRDAVAAPRCTGLDVYLCTDDFLAWATATGEDGKTDVFRGYLIYLYYVQGTDDLVGFDVHRMHLTSQWVRNRKAEGMKVDVVKNFSVPEIDEYFYYTTDGDSESYDYAGKCTERIEKVAADMGLTFERVNGLGYSNGGYNGVIIEKEGTSYPCVYKIGSGSKTRYASMSGDESNFHYLVYDPDLSAYSDLLSKLDDEMVAQKIDGIVKEDLPGSSFRCNVWQFAAEDGRLTVNAQLCDDQYNTLYLHLYNISFETEK